MTPHAQSNHTRILAAAILENLVKTRWNAIGADDREGKTATAIAPRRRKRSCWREQERFLMQPAVRVLLGVLLWGKELPVIMEYR